MIRRLSGPGRPSQTMDAFDCAATSLRTDDDRAPEKNRVLVVLSLQVKR